MSRCTLALLFLGSALIAQAEEAKPTIKADPKPDAKVAAKPVAPYELKTKSVFNLPSDTRAPFLPIGWVKPTGPVTVAVKTTIDESSFRLTSILLGNPSLAVINGRSYEEGQFLRMPRSGPQPIIRVYRIGDGQVWLQHDTKIFAVPLKRSELNERRTEGSLLNDERDAVPMPPSPAPTANPVPVPVPAPR